MNPVSFAYYRTPLILLAVVIFVCCATLIAAPDVGSAFLGSQGDTWDTQWDMFLALIGAVAAVPLFYRMHDRSMARLRKIL
jgi:uncharacterized membrane protein YjdF